MVSQSPDPLIFYPTVAAAQTLSVGTGEADRDVLPAMQRALVHYACAVGARVTWRRYAGLDHSATISTPLTNSLPYVESLLAGEPVPGATLHRERDLREKASPQIPNRNPVVMTKNRPGLQACAPTLSGRLCRKRGFA